MRCEVAPATWENAWMFTLVAGSVAQATIEVRKSRFIAHVAPVDSVESARSYISRIRAMYPDARHHCTAYVVESDGATAHTHSSDDGEPSGTAGPPILDILTGAELSNVVAVVTRYFGGTLLGTGGLIRAYSAATRAAVDDAQIAIIETLPRFRAQIPSSWAGKAEAEIRRRGWTVLDTDWGSSVRIDFIVPVEEATGVDPTLASLTKGDCVLLRLTDARLETPVSKR